MCRWLAYSGTPIKLEELLLKRDHSLIDQSLHSRMGATTTNGDGFGVAGTTRATRLALPQHAPRVERPNLKELAADPAATFFAPSARPRAPRSRRNTHPFPHGRGSGCPTVDSRTSEGAPRVVKRSATRLPLDQGTTDSRRYSTAYVRPRGRPGRRGRAEVCSSRRPESVTGSRTPFK
jgi:hypothetical protein